MSLPRIPHTITRNGIYYLNLRLIHGHVFRRSLLTDSNRHARNILSNIAPIVLLLRNLMNQDDVTFQAINKLTKILAARIREHANAAMYPTSSNSLHYKAKWNDFLGDIEAPEDVEQGEWKAYKDIYFKDKDTERALENLSNSVMPPIEQAKYIVRSLHQDDSPLFPNAVATIANVYKHAKKVRSSIEEFEFGDAENHLTQLDKYVEKLNL